MWQCLGLWFYSVDSHNWKRPCDICYLVYKSILILIITMLGEHDDVSLALILD